MPTVIDSNVAGGVMGAYNNCIRLDDGRVIISWASNQSGAYKGHAMVLNADLRPITGVLTLVGAGGIIDTNAAAVPGMSIDRDRNHLLLSYARLGDSSVWTARCVNIDAIGSAGSWYNVGGTSPTPDNPTDFNSQVSLNPAWLCGRRGVTYIAGRNQSGANWRIAIAEHRGLGHSWSSSIGMTDSPDTNVTEAPHLFQDDEGYIHCVYSKRASPKGNLYQRSLYPADINSWTPKVQISSPTPTTTTPQGLVAKKGRVAFCGADTTTRDYIYNYSNNNGRTWEGGTAGFILNNTTFQTATISMRFRGDGSVQFVRQDSTDSDYYAQLLYGARGTRPQIPVVTAGSGAAQSYGIEEWSDNHSVPNLVYLYIDWDATPDTLNAGVLPDKSGYPVRKTARRPAVPQNTRLSQRPARRYVLRGAA